MTANLPEDDPELYDAVRTYIHDRGEELDRSKRQQQSQQRQMTYG